MSDPPTQQRTIDALERTGALRRGHFVLASGRHSGHYCQCAALFERPDVGAELADLLAGRARDLAPTVVVAPALGGMLWGYQLAQAVGVRSIFAERHGPDRRFALRRGFRLGADDRALLAEDVVTTGGSVLEVADLVERAGAAIAGVACVLDRSAGAFAQRLADRRGGGFPVLALARADFPSYPPDQIPPDLAAVPIETPGSSQDV